MLHCHRSALYSREMCYVERWHVWPETMTDELILCKDPDYYFVLHVVTDLIDCKAKVCPKYVIDIDTGKPKHGIIGDVYFKPDSFKSGIIAHESLHMALTFIRIYKTPELSDDCDEDEEEIAMHTGWFAARLSEIYWGLQNEK